MNHPSLAQRIIEDAWPRRKVLAIPAWILVGLWWGYGLYVLGVSGVFGFVLAASSFVIWFTGMVWLVERAIE